MLSAITSASVVLLWPLVSDVVDEDAAGLDLGSDTLANKTQGFFGSI